MEHQEATSADKLQDGNIELEDQRDISSRIQMNPDENTNTIENSIAHLSPIDKSSGIKIMPLKSTDT